MPWATLGERFDPRANSLNTIRLLLACTVAITHAGEIAYGHQPTFGATQLGGMAVDAFFVLSGFLVAASYCRLGSFWRYAWHRFLRVMPAFWLTLVLTAVVVAPALAVLEGRSAASVFTGSDPSWRYVMNNALLYIGPDDFGVAGLPRGTFTPGVVNGALWTLFYEATCYGLVAAFGLFGMLHRRPWVVAAVTALAWSSLMVQEAAGVELPGALFLRFFVVFLFGTLAYLVRDRLPITGVGALVALGVVVASVAVLQDYRALGAPAFAYLCLWAAVATPWLRRSPRWDLSYGMYVFHWPIQTLLVLAGATALGRIGYTAVALVLAATCAALSWRFVESPALRLKDMAPPWSRPPAADDAEADRALVGPRR